MPLNAIAEVRAVAPGTTLILAPFFSNISTTAAPGSEIAGDQSDVFPFAQQRVNLIRAVLFVEFMTGKQRLFYLVMIEKFERMTRILARDAIDALESLERSETYIRQITYRSSYQIQRGHRYMIARFKRFVKTSRTTEAMTLFWLIMFTL